MNRTLIPTLFLGATIVGAASFSASAQQRVEAGLLDCMVESGTGTLFSSSKNVACTFNPAFGNRPPENYVGTVEKYGVDIGFTDEAVMQWLVLAPTRGTVAPGALAGGYIGAGADAAVGIGAGANALISTRINTVMLQPVSLQAQTGLNIAAGISAFRLQSTTR